MRSISFIIKSGTVWLTIVAQTCSSFAWSPTSSTSCVHRQQLNNGRQSTTTLSSSSSSSRRPGALAASTATESSSPSSSSSNNSNIDKVKRLETLAKLANDALSAHGNEVFKPFNAKVAVLLSDDDDDASTPRLGLLATESISKADQTIAALPYFDTDGSGLALMPHLATKLVYKDALPEGYDGWTGDIGLLALLLLNEMARLNIDSNGAAKGVPLPIRKPPIEALMSAYIATLPSHDEMTDLHPLLWNEQDQELLQSSSTKKIYRLLDDIDDDAAWLEEKVWALDRDMFPPSVTLAIGGSSSETTEERPCFSLQGFRYAVAIIRSRSFFVDGSLRLLPYLDIAAHADYDSYEIMGGGIGTLWGSAKGALLKSGKKMAAGEEIRISYGPKGPAEYLLDHGFVPPMCQYSRSAGGTSGMIGARGSAITSELSFEVADNDRFRDDKLDVLEYETYDLAPMEPLQLFDVTGGIGSTGEPDPAMIQFLRLVKLGGRDAFLLESIFRKEIWEFMSEPVSEENEREVVLAVVDACQKALEDLEESSSSSNGTNADDGADGVGLSKNQKLCALVRESERHALENTLIYMKQEETALDLKEYYQTRRLKSLGLDSDWSPEDDEVGFGGTRVPGGADYDW